MTRFYLAENSGNAIFPFRVLERFDSTKDLLARLATLTAIEDDYDEGLSHVFGATYIASADYDVAVGKCLAVTACKFSNLRHGPASTEAEPIIRAFAARLDRLHAGAVAWTEQDEAEARAEMEAIAREPRSRAGWR